MGWKRNALSPTHYDAGSGALCGAKIASTGGAPKTSDPTLCRQCHEILLEQTQKGR